MLFDYLVLTQILQNTTNEEREENINEWGFNQKVESFNFYVINHLQIDSRIGKLLFYNNRNKQ